MKLVLFRLAVCHLFYSLSELSSFLEKSVHKAHELAQINGLKSYAFVSHCHRRLEV